MLLLQQYKTNFCSHIDGICYHIQIVLSVCRFVCIVVCLCVFRFLPQYHINIDEIDIKLISLSKKCTIIIDFNL